MIPRTLTIIGGAGFLGRSLITRLAATAGWADTEIRCLDRVAYPADATRPARFAEYVGDAHDHELITDALRGAQAVWIRAAMLGGTPSTDPARITDYLDRNVDLVAQVLDACDLTGCQRVLFDSSEQVFGDPADQQAQTPHAEPLAGNYYGAGKLIAEKLLRLWSTRGPDRSVQIMRYSRVRDADTRDVIRVMLTHALAGNPLRILGNSTRRVAFVHLDDVLAVNLVALRRAPRYALYHVGTDRPVSLYELASRVRAACTHRHRHLVGHPCRTRHIALRTTRRGHARETSRRELGLPAPRGLDDMLHETLTRLHQD